MKISFTLGPSGDTLKQTEFGFVIVCICYMQVYIGRDTPSEIQTIKEHLDEMSGLL